VNTEKKMDRKYVDSIEKVGNYKGEDVFLVKSKGGYCCMGLKKASGRLELMQGGGHRAIAKHIADMKCPGIEWHHDKLYKSDTEVESTPEKHMQMADYHAKLANKYAHMSSNPEQYAGEVNNYYRSFNKDHQDMSPFQMKHDMSMHNLGHKDIALAHYSMAGLQRPEAIKRLSEQTDNNVALNSKAPGSESELRLAWQRKNPHKRVPGIGFDHTR
jgi:hypothetical protein